ncbi:LOW QUALITY PROTEIN: protein KRI1 homolog [Leptosomus discolor]
MPEPELRGERGFADRYRRYRRREELQRLQDRYATPGDGSGSSSGSDSSGDEVDTDPRLERDFYRTLSLLKTRDPRIYRQDATLLPAASDAGEEEEEEEEEERPAEPMYLRDYERKVVLEKEGKYVDEEEEEDEEAAAERRKRAASRSYAEEQRELKESRTAEEKIYRLLQTCWEADASFRPPFRNLVPLLRSFHEKYRAQAPSVFSLC